MARLEEADVQELNDIASYHEDTVRALTNYFADWKPIHNDRYFGMTHSEISNIYQKRLTETEFRSILQALAAVEAALRIDYLSRCKQRAKDPLSRTFRETYKQKAERVRLDEDILESWVDHHPELKSIVSQLRGALHLRHWLAHGRYWRPNNWIRYSYLEIEALATAFFEIFPLSH